MSHDQKGSILIWMILSTFIFKNRSRIYALSCFHRQCPRTIERSIPILPLWIAARVSHSNTKESNQFQQHLLHGPQNFGKVFEETFCMCYINQVSFQGIHGSMLFSKLDWNLCSPKSKEFPFCSDYSQTGYLAPFIWYKGPPTHQKIPFRQKQPIFWSWSFQLKNCIYADGGNILNRSGRANFRLTSGSELNELNEQNSNDFLWNTALSLRTI